MVMGGWVSQQSQREEGWKGNERFKKYREDRLENTQCLLQRVGCEKGGGESLGGSADDGATYKDKEKQIGSGVGQGEEVR